MNNAPAQLEMTLMGELHSVVGDTIGEVFIPLCTEGQQRVISTGEKHLNSKYIYTHYN